MTTRTYARVAAVAAACIGLAAPGAASLAAPSSALAATGTTTGSGGAGMAPTPAAAAPSAAAPVPTSADPTTTTAGTTTTGTTTVQADPIGGPVSASGDGFTLSTTAAGTYRKALSFSGEAPSADAGSVLEIQRRAGRGAWLNTAHATIAPDGSFSVAWRANRSGRLSFRATLQGAVQAAAKAQQRSAHAAAIPASPALAVTIYQNSIATIYGPGLYGRKTACGQRLRPTTIGVASRTLKCGTKVSISYDGVSVTVPVIDRGPFAHGATWDLTEATAAALGDPETEIVGAAVL